MGKARAFRSGATRDTEEGKYDFEGFIDPKVLWAYAEHMNRNRVQSDGTLRDSDNWQQGIPRKAYMKSLLRHVVDLWLIHRGHEVVRPEDGRQVTLEESLGAIVFNVMGYWSEVLKRGEERAAPDGQASS